MFVTLFFSLLVRFLIYSPGRFAGNIEMNIEMTFVQFGVLESGSVGTADSFMISTLTPFKLPEFY